MIVGLLDNAIPPWLEMRNEQENYSLAQAETNKRLYSSGMGRAPIKVQIIVYLKVLGDVRMQPIRIKSAQDTLRSPGASDLIVTRAKEKMFRVALFMSSHNNEVNMLVLNYSLVTSTWSIS